MQNRLFQIISVYLLSLGIILCAMWLVLEWALPEQEGRNLLTALSTSIRMKIPDEVLGSSHSVGFAVLQLTVLSIALTVINVYFTAFLTSHLITPRVRLITSTRGVWTNRWDYINHHILVRMVNFQGRDLVNVEVEAVLIVEEVRENDGKEEVFVCYLPIGDVLTPRKVLILKDRSPWCISIPAKMELSNSLTKDYPFEVGKEVTQSFSHGKRLISCKRRIEILIKGVDSKAYSNFIMRRTIDVDEETRDKEYILHLHKGGFKSLPLQVDSEEDVEQYVTYDDTT